MISKKLIIFFILLIIIVLYIVYSMRQQAPLEEKKKVIVPTIYSQTTRAPILAKINIGGVYVNDFFYHGEKLNINNDIRLRKTSSYEIVYLYKFKQFVISIFSSNFDSTRKEAENDLVNILGISTKEACRLQVSEGTSYKINPDYAYLKLGLSFCNL